MGDNNFEFNSLLKRIDDLRSDIAEIRDELKYRYVTKEEFKPIALLVYGLVGITLTWAVNIFLSTIH